MNKSNGYIQAKVSKRTIEHCKECILEHIEDNTITTFTHLIWFTIGYFEKEKVVPIEIIDFADELAKTRKITR